MDDTGSFLPHSPMRVYAMAERAHEELYDYLAVLTRAHGQGDMDQHITSLIYATAFSMDAAGWCYGLVHNDLHMGNVMVRSVVDTPYAGRTWAYRHRANPDLLVLITPPQHRDRMIEIIDFGFAEMRGGPDRYVESEVEYAEDALEYDLGRFIRSGTDVIHHRLRYYTGGGQPPGLIDYLRNFIGQQRASTHTSLLRLVNDIDHLLDQVRTPRPHVLLAYNRC